MVCYCIEFQVLVLRLCTNSLSCFVESIFLLPDKVCTPILCLLQRIFFRLLTHYVVSPPTNPVCCAYALADFQQHPVVDH